MRAWVAAALGFGLAGCAGVGGPLIERPEPLSAVAPAGLADQVAERGDRGCAEALREQLLAGARKEGACDVSQSPAARATIIHNGVRFGVVAHRDVELDRVRMRLSEARLCRGWPMPRSAEDGTVLHETDAERSGCVLRPYEGELSITAVDAEGRRHRALIVQASRDGVASFDFSEIDAALRATFSRGLDSYDWLELGETAWAGTVHLDRLRGYLADWHFVWVAKGRGSVGLFAERHPSHARGPDAKAYAVEARVVRQREDFVAVEAGKMSTSEFLEQHVWSPFRRAVEQLRATET